MTTDTQEYLLVQNPGEIPMWGIRLLGLSKKSEEQIGQFGTGLKEAIALLARLDALPIIYIGETRMVFEQQEQDGQQEIGFVLDKDHGRFKAGEWSGMGLHPNFGHRDWTFAWEALREIFCNAIDEGVDLMHYELTRETSGVAGSTRIYIPAITQVKHAFYTIDKKLLALSSPTVLHECATGKIFAKIGAGEGAQIYHKGVWVGEIGKDSLYDYEIVQMSLTESRHIKSIDVVRREISYLLARAPSILLEPILVGIVEKLDKINDGTDGLPAEFREAINVYYIKSHVEGSTVLEKENQERWQDAWRVAHREKGVACLPTTQHYEKVKSKGFIPVFVPSYWYEILKAAGIPTPGDILSKDEFESLEIIERRTSGCPIWAKLKQHGIAKTDQPTIHVFRTLTGNSLMGMCRNGTIYINETIVGSNEEADTLMHEYAHLLSGAADESKAFEMFLIGALTRVLFPV